MILWLLLPLTASAWAPLTTCAGAPTAWPDGSPETRFRMSSVFVSDEVPAPTVAGAVRIGFDEWGRPGCSNFNVFQDADAFGDPLDGENDDNLIGWYESGWPAQLGAATLAVTLPVWWEDDCELFSADMVFNGDDHDWVLGPPGDWYEADIQSVATHEAGHWVGFDHSGFGGSSMQSLYSGALDERTLTCDDTVGACALYPSGDDSCTDDRYCACDQTCDGGTCRVALGDDDDDTEPDPECEGPGREYDEGEPNDDPPASFEISDGDATIQGRIDCANNGSEYTGDHDFLALLPVCDETAVLTLEWAGGADLDFLGFRGDGTALFENQTVEQQGPIQSTALLGAAATALVVCWEGAEVDWTLTVDWPPYRTISSGDDDGDDDDATEDERPTTGLGEVDGRGCRCAAGRSGWSALALIPLALRRRRTG